MSHCLGSNDSSEPTVKHVEAIVGQIQGSDQGIVSTGHDDEWDRVDDRHGSGAIAKMGQHLQTSRPIPLDPQHA